jgi:hypothetical protein
MANVAALPSPPPPPPPSRCRPVRRTDRVHQPQALARLCVVSWRPRAGLVLTVGGRDVRGDLPHCGATASGDRPGGGASGDMMQHARLQGPTERGGTAAVVAYQQGFLHFLSPCI